MYRRGEVITDSARGLGLGNSYRLLELHSDFPLLYYTCGTLLKSSNVKYSSTRLVPVKIMNIYVLGNAKKTSLA